jgi:lipopolysaccharide transport system permease protein
MAKFRIERMNHELSANGVRVDPHGMNTPVPAKTPAGAVPSRDELPLVVYTPNSGLEHPRTLLHRIWQDTFSRQSRNLARSMTVRALAGQFRQSLLGYFWLFFPPLFYSAVFIFLNREGIVQIEDTPIPYTVFVLIGNLAWQGFMQGIQAPLKAVQRQMTILTKLNISREAVLLSGLYEAVITAVIPLAALPVIFFFFGIPASASMLLGVCALLILILLGFMIGLWLTPLGALYKDIGQAVPLLMRFMMFATPVVYPLPTTPGLGRTLLLLNPTTPFIECARNWLTGQPAELSMLFGLYSLLTVVLLIGGVIIYRLAMPIIVERMSS